MLDNLPAAPRHHRGCRIRKRALMWVRASTAPRIRRPTAIPAWTTERSTAGRLFLPREHRVRQDLLTDA